MLSLENSCCCYVKNIYQIMSWYWTYHDSTAIYDMHKIRSSVIIWKQKTFSQDWVMSSKTICGIGSSCATQGKVSHNIKVAWVNLINIVGWCLGYSYTYVYAASLGNLYDHFEKRRPIKRKYIHSFRQPRLWKNHVSLCSQDYVSSVSFGCRLSTGSALVGFK